MSSSSSYKSCLPVSHRHDIQRRNRLDRYRIRTTLRRFLKKLGGCSVDERSLKLKYLIELAGVVPSLGSETFPVKPSPRSRATFSLLKVTWERGIETGGARDPDGGPVSVNSGELRLHSAVMPATRRRRQVIRSGKCPQRWWCFFAACCRWTHRPRGVPSCCC